MNLMRYNIICRVCFMNKKGHNSYQSFRSIPPEESFARFARDCVKVIPESLVPTHATQLSPVRGGGGGRRRIFAPRDRYSSSSSSSGRRILRGRLDRRVGKVRPSGLGSVLGVAVRYPADEVTVAVRSERKGRQRIGKGEGGRRRGKGGGRGTCKGGGRGGGEMRMTGDGKAVGHLFPQLVSE